MSLITDTPDYDPGDLEQLVNDLGEDVATLKRQRAAFARMAIFYSYDMPAHAMMQLAQEDWPFFRQVKSELEEESII